MIVHSDSEPLGPVLKKIQWVSLLAGVLGLAALVAGAFLGSRQQVFQSYLFGYLFWLGLSLGGSAIVMIHHLVGGVWGFPIRRVLESAALMIVPLAVLFVPLLFGLHELYEWTHHEVVQHDPVLQKKTGYLNVPFFIGRAIVYFVVWLGLIYFLNRWSLQQDRTGDPALSPKLRWLSRFGLIGYMLTVTFAAFDWVMSLEPHWYSTIYGAIFAVGFGLAALAFAIIVLIGLSRGGALEELTTARNFHDLGNLLLAFLMLWAYVSFSQLLIIWSGNLPEEVTWYVHRTSGAWAVIPPLLIGVHFFLPFFLLLSRRIKRNTRPLLAVAGLVLMMRLVDIFWFVAPAFHREGLHISWMDLAAPVGLGGLWLAGFAWLLQRRSLVPVHDPRLEAVLTHVEHEHA